MGNTNSIKKLNFKDMQNIIYNNNYTIINTLDNTIQNCLIINTISPENEIKIINHFLKENRDANIVIYGKNCNDNKLLNKYNQLITLGFSNVSVYIGGLFEWLMLQDIYGNDMFPTTSKQLDFLKFMPESNL